MNNHPYGCDGYLSTYARFKPEIAHKYWNAIENNNLKEAVNVIATYDIPLFDLIKSFTGKFDAGVHGALELFGVAERWRRPPYYTINDEDMEKLTGFFKDLSLL